MDGTLELEHSITGAICRDPAAIRSVAPYLRPEDFAIAPCAEVYRAALDAMREGRLFDGFIAADLLAGRIENPRQFIADCITVCPSTANAEEHARLLRKKADERNLRQKIIEILAGEEDDLAAAIAGVCTAQIQDRPLMRAKTLSDAVNAAYDALWTPPKLRIDTGFGKLDALLKGFNGGEFVLIGARPSVGKSAFGLAIAEHAAAAGNPVLLFSMEMLSDEVAERILVRHTQRVTLDAMIDRGLDDRQAEEVARAVCDTAGLPIVIDDSPKMTVETIRARALAERDLAMIVVDYVGLMQTERQYDSRNAELTEISRGLKNLAVELRIPVVALAQLNRELHDQQKPELRNLRDSGSLEQDANKVLMLWNIDPEHHVVGCFVAKNRRGRTGVVQLYFEGEHMQFAELAEEYQEPEPRRKRRGGFLDE